MTASLTPLGWWYYNVNDGKIHDHPTTPGRGWSQANHRICEPVYPQRVADEVVRLHAIKKTDDGAYEHVVELYHEESEHARLLAVALSAAEDQLFVARMYEAECKSWMNGVADVVEPYGFDREAACGPADLLPGLKTLVETIAALRLKLATYEEVSPPDCDPDCNALGDGAHAPMCARWEP